ncbi:molecular chaperone [Providencia sp. AGC89]
MSKKYVVALGLSLVFVGMQFASAAINIDRTRIIFPGKDKSISLVINNQSKTMPYLAQSWMEDEKGNKVSEPFTVLPPMQRVEPNAKNQIKIIKTEGVDLLPQDRESLFYLNVREIPPVADKENIVQIAIQSRLKMFYRPPQIENNSDKVWAKELKYIHKGNQLLIENPTKYYVTLGYLSNNNRNNFPGFESVMVAPLSKERVVVPSEGFTQLYTGYMDDYGGMKMLTYRCVASTCQLSKESQ